MACPIREHTAKTLLRLSSPPLAGPSVLWSSTSPPEELPWMDRLVVKPDVLLKRRGTLGLVKCDLSFEEAKSQFKFLTDLKVGCSGGKHTHILCEPYVPHSEEFYLAIRPHRTFDEILFSAKGGMDVGDVDENSKKLKLFVGKPSAPIPESFFVGVESSEIRSALARYVRCLHEIFVKKHFCFLEINPLVWDISMGCLVPLDCAARLDTAADFLDVWDVPVEFPLPYGRELSAAEQYVRELDAKTGASLKLTLLNPKGRLWPLVAGGGASVVLADTLCEFGLANEVAIYGEYSGAPSEAETYEYARTVFGLMTAEGSHRKGGKCLLIGGSIANFTSVADTFHGIIRALEAYQTQLHHHRVRIYVRRGGPSYEEGLASIKRAGDNAGLPTKVFGPETYLTDIVSIAVSELGLVCGDEVAHLSTPSSSSSNGHLSPTETIASWWPGFGKIATVTTGANVTPVNRPKEVTMDVKKDWQLFDCNTRSFVWGLHTGAVQEMLDFDHVCGREIPSVAAIIYSYAAESHLRPFYFGTEEILIPVVRSFDEAFGQFPEVDTIVNFASRRSVFDISREVLLAYGGRPLQTMAIIAEGVPERQARQLLVLAAERNVRIIGPATVGGIRSGCFRIGNTGGRLENIMNARLYRGGSAAFVTKSGGMLNEMNNVLSMVADGVVEGVAIGGDRFPASSLLDHLIRYEKDPAVKYMLMLGEVGGTLEYEVADAIKNKILTKPLVAWCIGTCADSFHTEVAFGHAGAWAGSTPEFAQAKNEALRLAGAIVPKSFAELGHAVRTLFESMVSMSLITVLVEPPLPRVPIDYAWAKKLGLVRRPKGFITTISDDRGEEVVYAGWPISKVLESNMGVGGVISLLWFKRPLAEKYYRFLEYILMVAADHGPAVCGAHNTIVTARAGKDLISSLIAGLCTIGDRFGGVCDTAAQQFLDAHQLGQSPEEFVNSMKSQGKLIMGLGHTMKSVHHPDMRVQLLKKFCRDHFDRLAMLEFAEAVERLTTQKKETLILNVDGLIGVSMVDLLFGSGAFTEAEARDYIKCGSINGLFVLGRSIGFIGHFLDQRRLKQGLYRHDADDISYVLPELTRKSTR